MTRLNHLAGAENNGLISTAVNPGEIKLVMKDLEQWRFVMNLINIEIPTKSLRISTWKWNELNSRVEHRDGEIKFEIEKKENRIYVFSQYWS